MMDDLELPPLPTSLPVMTRKRTRSDYEPATSSDPALFSSDEQAPSAEIYVSKRRKDIWAGTWWGAKARDAAMKRKRSFRRNHDSGIFMGSEGTDMSLEDELIDDMQRKYTETAVRHQRKFQRLPEYAKIGLEKLPHSILLSHLHHQVSAIVQTCLEHGKEDVDLSSMSLKSLPPDVATLKSLTKQTGLNPVPGELSSSQEAYTSIEAHLRVYLANNSFTQLPHVLLDLSNLRFLSLRQNDLTELPPGIRRLVNLEHLNISGNKLQCLPFEILDLVHSHCLNQLIADRNPWMLPPASAIEVASQVKIHHPRSSTITQRLAVGTPETLRPNGTVDWTAQERTKVITDIESSRCPGLAELVLRRISKLQSLSNLDDWISDDFPETVKATLVMARDTQTAGGRICTTCGESIIIPRRQWMEWWSMSPLSPNSSPSHERLPFFRQQCHPRCGGNSP